MIPKKEDDVLDDGTEGQAAAVQLSEDQQRVLDLVSQGHNVFFTGNAGSGKSFLLERIVKHFRQKYGSPDEFRKRVAVTATTGVAATHIGGLTLNAALGLGIVNKYADFNTMKSPHAARRISDMHVLIIDECSMLSGEMLETLERHIREIRAKRSPKSAAKPAGGVQMILAGDFFQLPPISRQVARDTSAEVFTNFGYAFMAPAWKRCGFKTVVLQTVFRQKDPALVDALNAIRKGPDSKAARNALRRIVKACLRPLDEFEKKTGIVPTHIFPRNDDVNRMNETEMKRLIDGGMTEHALSSKDDAIPENPFTEDAPRRREQLLSKSEFFRDCAAQQNIVLCRGAQVMLLRNLDTPAGRVNGSRGVVIDFVPKEDVLMDATRGAQAMIPRASPYIDISALGAWRGNLLPIVRFTDGAQLVVLPSRFSVSVNGGECVRIQVPLKLAWAITVHKSQGMSLDAARLSLKSMFAVGQAYVALSRVRSLDGLQVLDWDMGCLQTDDFVKEFYDHSYCEMSKDNDCGDDNAENASRMVGSEQKNYIHHPAWQAYLDRRGGGDDGSGETGTRKKI